MLNDTNDKWHNDHFWEWTMREWTVNNERVNNERVNNVCWTMPTSLCWMFGRPSTRKKSGLRFKAQSGCRTFAPVHASTLPSFFPPHYSLWHYSLWDAPLLPLGARTTPYGRKPTSPNLHSFAVHWYIVHCSLKNCSLLHCSLKNCSILHCSLFTDTLFAYYLVITEIFRNFGLR